MGVSVEDMTWDDDTIQLVQKCTTNWTAKRSEPFCHEDNELGCKSKAKLGIEQRHVSIPL